MKNLLSCAAILLWVSSSQAQVARSAVPAAEPGAYRAMLDQYCVGCHNDKLKTAQLSLERSKVDTAHLETAPEIWENVLKKVRTGAMPPAKMRRPEAVTLAAFTSWLETELDRAASRKPNPGRTATFHRLNRTEYQNAVRDLLALDIDASTLLPADASNDLGFDNIATSLTVSPVLLERYLSAARHVSQLAVGASVQPDQRVFRLASDFAQDDRLSDLPFGSRGGTSFTHSFPVDGEYSFKISFVRGGGGNQTVAGLNDQQQLDVRLDGERIQLVTFGQKPAPGRGGGPGGPGGGPGGPGGGPGGPGGGPGGGRGSAVAVPDPEFKVPVTAGSHTVSVTFFRRPPAVPEGMTRRVQSVSYEAGSTHGQPYISSVAISGPEKMKAPGESPSRKRIFTCKPPNAAEEAACAKQILNQLARRAFRRTVTEADVQTLFAFYSDGRKEKDFETGIERAVTRVLVSPSFLFRAELDPPKMATGMAYPINDVDLASRLSFFLWSSIPDEELLTLASQGRLKDDKILEAQVLRMLSDPRADAFVENFAGQWLRLRDVPVFQPDASAFPGADANLKLALRRQTELLFETVLRENRSVYELLTANFTYLNERLARHYGVPNIYGDHLRRVVLADGDVRGGLLGQGSILMVTSYGNRTSPVLRGKFLLDTLLGTPPPPPPPNVPELKNTNEAGKVLSMRDRMTQHRADPACAGCHARMDPLGFALEGFDAIGRTRTRGEGNTAIDASGELPDGTKFEGPTGLRDMLLRNKEQFRHTVIEKLMTYALGRGVEYYDQPAIRSIAREAEKHNNSLVALITGTVKSAPFRMRRSQSEAIAELVRK